MLNLFFRNISRTFVVVFCAALLTSSLFLCAEAQGVSATQPQIFLTWQARGYVPPSYQGKALPAANSVVTASMEVIDQGRIADISNKSVYWYQDGLLVGSGLGKKTVNFRTASQAPTQSQLMVQVQGYKGQLLFNTIVLPVAQPTAVIEAPYTGNISGGNSVTVKGVPYFFNVPDMNSLVFNWVVNGTPASPPATSTDKSVLAITTNSNAAPGSTLNIGLTIQDPKEQLYYGSAHMTLTISK